MRQGDFLNLPGKISETVLMEFFIERGASHKASCQSFFIREIRGLKSAWRGSSLQVVPFQHVAVVLARPFDWNGLSLAG